MKKIIISFLVMGTLLVLGAADMMQAEFKGKIDPKDLKQFVPNTATKVPITLNVPLVLDRIPEGYKINNKLIDKYLLRCTIFKGVNAIAYKTIYPNPGQYTETIEFNDISPVTASKITNYACYLYFIYGSQALRGFDDERIESYNINSLGNIE